MKRSRPEFINTSAALAAWSAVGTRPAGARPLQRPSERWDDRCAWMKLSFAYFSEGVRGRPERVALAKQLGAHEENRNPGYNDLGALFAFGYIKGLMEAVMKK